MNSCIQGSCIPVAVPTELYASLLDHLSRSAMDYDEPSAAVTAILRSYLDEARSNPPRCANAALSPGRTNNSIALGSPPVATKDKPPRSAKQPNKSQSNDWCIGCGCPAEDLIV